MRWDSLNPVISVPGREITKVPLPTRTRVLSAARGPIPEPVAKRAVPDRPRIVRMPSDWWDAPSAAALALAPTAQPAKNARRFTRATLGRWGLETLADDAEIIVGEFVANAIRHANRTAGGGDSPATARADSRIGLRIFRRSGEVMCAVLDPSDTAPVLKPPTREAECGRGLQLVDALSDVWGWSPVVGHGKAVWAILFCA
jgi:anti-sigma regulatory factor (Ser/Thr protein kinase)